MYITTLKYIKSNNLFFMQPDEQKEFVDDYERPDLEKYEKVTPTPSNRTKKQNGVREVYFKTYNLWIQ